jgi:hypothetical protein
MPSLSKENARVLLYSDLCQLAGWLEGLTYTYEGTADADWAQRCYDWLDTEVEKLRR